MLNFFKIPSIRSRVVPCGRADGRTDGHDEDNSRFSQFYESAKKNRPHYVLNTQFLRRREQTLSQMGFRPLNCVICHSIMTATVKDMLKCGIVLLMQFESSFPVFLLRE